MFEENNQEFRASQTEEVNNGENAEVKEGEVVGEDGFSVKDKEDNKLMAALSYVSILSLFPYLLVKDSSWVKYHAIQGINLFIIELICLGIKMIPLLGGLISSIVGAICFGLSIIGIINVCNEEAKELPIIKNIQFIKK